MLRGSEKEANFPDASVTQILAHMQSGRMQAALDLIAQAPLITLNTIFELASKKTTLLCEAGLMQSLEVVAGLLERGIEVNTNIQIDDWLVETALCRIISDKSFDEKSLPICKLLIGKAAKLEYRYFSDESIFSKIYKAFPFNDDEEAVINKFKLLKDALGDLFYEQLLYLFSEDCDTFIHQRKEYTNHLFQYLLDITLAHFKIKKDISKQDLTRLLISSEFDDKVVDFVKSTIAKEHDKPKIDQAEKQEELYVETEYPSDQFNDPEFGLFQYANEKKSFQYALDQLKSPLSYELLDHIHKMAILSTEAQGKALVMTRVPIGSCHKSILGFLEKKECEHKKQWFTIRRYGTYFDRWLMCPKPSDAQLKALLNEYNDDMSKIVPRKEKLKRIIQLCSDLSRMHYFADANKRYSYILFNRELIKHGFLPSFIEDRSIFRILSQDEIYFQILNGMEKCLTHLKTLKQARAPSPLASADRAVTFSYSSAEPMFRAQSPAKPTVGSAMTVGMEPGADESITMQSDDQLADVADAPKRKTASNDSIASRIKRRKQ